MSAWSLSTRGRWFLGAAAVIAAAIALSRFDPEAARFIPPCPFHWLTGAHCPGCGSLRSLHALLNGDLAQAFAFNPLTALAAPALTAWALYSVWCRLTVLGHPKVVGFDLRSVGLTHFRRANKPQACLPIASKIVASPLTRRSRIPIALLTIFIAFWVLRNIPVAPLTLLAPHRL